MESIVCKHWHHCPSSEVTTLLDTNPDKGLSLFEAKHRLEKIRRQYGYRTEAKKPSAEITPAISPVADLYFACRHFCNIIFTRMSRFFRYLRCGYCQRDNRY
jgi:hypothetical protein